MGEISRVREFENRFRAISIIDESEFRRPSVGPYFFRPKIEEESKYYIFIITPEDFSRYEDINIYAPFVQTKREYKIWSLHGSIQPLELEVPKIISRTFSPFPRNELSRLEQKITKLENEIKNANIDRIPNATLPIIGVISSLLIILIAKSFFSNLSMWILLLGAFFLLGINFKTLLSD